MFEVFIKIVFEIFDKIVFKVFDKIVLKIYDKIYVKVVNENKIINVKVIEIVIVFDFLKLFAKTLMCSKYFVKTQIRLLISNSSSFLL